jgi:hypothetical protein
MYFSGGIVEDKKITEEERENVSAYIDFVLLCLCVCTVYEASSVSLNDLATHNIQHVGSTYCIYIVFLRMHTFCIPPPPFCVNTAVTPPHPPYTPPLSHPPLHLTL